MMRDRRLARLADRQAKMLAALSRVFQLLGQAGITTPGDSRLAAEIAIASDELREEIEGHKFDLEIGETLQT